MENILVGIGHFFKKLFGWVIHSDPFKQLVAHLLPTAVAVVQSLASVEALSSAQKRDQAVATLASAAKEQGLAFANSELNFLVELAVQKLKGTIGPE